MSYAPEPARRENPGLPEVHHDASWDHFDSAEIWQTHFVNLTWQAQGRQFVENMGRNLELRMDPKEQIIGIDAWHDKYDGPAIIVGAGPSLHENIEQLKRAYANNIPIMAVDRAVPVLGEAGIIPFAVLNIEAYFHYLKDWWGDFDTRKSHLVILYRCDTDIVNYWKGPRTLVNTLFSDMEQAQAMDMITRAVGDQPVFSGLNVGVFGLVFSAWCGFRPISFVGLDHAFYNEPDPNTCANMLWDPVRGKECWVTIPWFFGNHEIHYIAKKLQEHPTKSGRVINCSEGGIIYGGAVERMSMDELNEEFGWQPEQFPPKYEEVEA